MRSLLIILLVISLPACQRRNATLEKRLQDTLAVLRVKADFKPLPADEAYNFMNTCYLPRLDTLRLGRRIFINPLTGTDYNKVFERDSVALRAFFWGDTASTNKLDMNLYAHPSFKLDSNLTWDESRLKNTSIVRDTFIINFYKRPGHISFEERERWYKTIKPGYMMVSYPQYNAHTNKLFIREWLENTSSCGTGRDRDFVFNKINGAWKIQQ